jgi:hypothetical protein
MFGKFCHPSYVAMKGRMTADWEKKSGNGRGLIEVLSPFAWRNKVKPRKTSSSHFSGTPNRNIQGFHFEKRCYAAGLGDTYCAANRTSHSTYKNNEFPYYVTSKVLGHQRWSPQLKGQCAAWSGISHTSRDGDREDGAMLEWWLAWTSEETRGKNLLQCQHYIITFDSASNLKYILVQTTHQYECCFSWLLCRHRNNKLNNSAKIMYGAFFHSCLLIFQASLFRSLFSVYSFLLFILRVIQTLKWIHFKYGT